MEHSVREFLAVAIAGGFCEAFGDWTDASTLTGVVGWRNERDLAVRSQFGEGTIWHCTVLAVAIGYRRQGRARGLKQALIAEARRAGVLAVTSIVAWDNAPMLDLNRSLGGSTVRIMSTFGPDEHYCRCIVPVR